MAASIRQLHLDPQTGGYIQEWEVDPILAIGGQHHGEVLPAMRGIAPIMVPERPSLTTMWLADPEPEIRMPQVYRYEIHRCVTAGQPGRARKLFPVYVLTGFPQQEALVWVELVAAWSRLLVTVNRLGCLLSRIPGGIYRRREAVVGPTP